MGIHVDLAVVVERVSDAKWKVIYDRARRVARSWTPPPLSVAWRQIGAVCVAAYTPTFETEAGLHIVGDATTFTTGESFVFPRTLGARRSRVPRTLGARRSRDVRSRSPAGPEQDVVIAVALRNVRETDPRCYDRLFGDKTQGFPYHTLIVALGLLVETALPGIAVVYGDLDVKDGEQARRGLAAILEEDIELPVVLDARRLRQRLSAALHGDELERAVHELDPDVPCPAALADLLGRALSTPRARMQRELERVVRSCRDATFLMPETREMVRGVLDAIRSAMARHEIRQRVEQWGAARTRELIALQTQDRMWFTAMTWDALEVADLDELAFVYTAVGLESEWHVNHAVRALIENHAMRQL